MKITLLSIAFLPLVGCGHPASLTPPAPDTAIVDSDAATDAPAVRGLGAVGQVADQPTCPGAPQGSTCKHAMISGCPGIETETLGARLAILEPTTAVRGTVVHFSGGGGDSFESTGSPQYRGAGFRQVFVAWDSDWEQTTAAGIKTAACRSATVMRWIFDNLHAGGHTAAFCGQGRSGGSGQLTYALAHYQMGDYFDYVNAISGPPFARIDLGCDGDAAATATVCGDPVTTRLPTKVGTWENSSACGATGVAADVLARWHDDSVGIGGTYDYPHTRLEMFDCTNQATAVTAMSQLLYDQISSAEQDPTRAVYHCYSAADSCQGEGLGNGGDAEAFQALVDGCVPNHQ